MSPSVSPSTPARPPQPRFHSSSPSWGSDHGGRPGSGMRGPSLHPLPSCQPPPATVCPASARSALPGGPGSVSGGATHSRRQLLVWGPSSSSPFFWKQPLPCWGPADPCPLSSQERLAPSDPSAPHDLQPLTLSGEPVASGRPWKPASARDSRCCLNYGAKGTSGGQGCCGVRGWGSKPAAGQAPRGGGQQGAEPATEGGGRGPG